MVCRGWLPHHRTLHSALALLKSESEKLGPAKIEGSDTHVDELDYLALWIENRPYGSNRADVTLPRFTSQIFTTAARGCSNFNNLRKAAAGRVVTSLEFYSGPFCCGP